MALGDLEQAVLFAIARLGGESHGTPIAEEISEATGRDISPGALYTVLDRLEEKGFVQSWIGESTPARGGRRRKVYRLLPEGARELQGWYAGIRKLASGTDSWLDRLAGEVG